MIWAVKGEHVKCMELLLQKGADLEAKGEVRDEYDEHIWAVQGGESGREKGVV